jgi:hypothetical protein
MAGLIQANLIPQSSMANNSAARFWSYKTVDTKANVVTSGYFNDVANNFTAGDMIWCHTASGGTPLWFWVKIVAISAAGVVTTNSSAVVFS